MAKRFAFIGLTIISGLASLGVSAQTSTSKTNLNGQTDFVSTAVPFLRISPDARAGGMGDAAIAVSPDANAQYWDLAKIPFSDKKFGVSATYTPWLKDLVPDIFLAYLAGYVKFGENNDQAISASMRYFSLGNINYTDYNANPTGSGMPREYSFDIGYSRRLSPYLGVGVAIRYIHSAIASGVSSNAGSTDYKPGNALAGDAGIYYSKTKDVDGLKSRTFNFGVVASNLGSKISYNSTRKDFIPMNLGIGVAYTSKFDEYNSITFALDFNKLLVPPLDSSSDNTNTSIVSGITKSFSDPGFSGDVKQIDISLGAEYWYRSQFALRAGYFYENPDNGDRQYFTAGIGAKYNVFQLNASYLIPSGSGISRNPLSNTLRFSLVFEFDKLQKAADESSTTE